MIVFFSYLWGKLYEEIRKINENIGEEYSAKFFQQGEGSPC